jgi:hypothetical protein
MENTARNMASIDNIKSMEVRAKQGSEMKNNKKKGFEKRVLDVLHREAELKFFSTTLGPAATDFTGNVYDISNVGQGVTDSLRVGDSLDWEDILLRYSVVSADTTQLFRMILFSWAQNSANPPATPASVLSTIGSVFGPLSPTVFDQSATVTILWDKLLCLNSVSVPNQCGTVYLKVPDYLKRVQFLNGTTNGNNRIYFCCISDSGAVAHPTIQFYARLTYHDE